MTHTTIKTSQIVRNNVVLTFEDDYTDTYPGTELLSKLINNGNKMVKQANEDLERGFIARNEKFNKNTVEIF